ncbi:hypothetical protein SNOG_08755 [Parastagonospora nodorum SN15]|uniref:Uncharacterized protein n=1 Tax=Phaeosphaeria nodorum (strain SN15 / ATCC MYA-4574 / FGSC 10173) TaxID=321614 RepID=Q0UHK9_PHANO|nr:hypothetical protein SNOG_08755 [Parastagonospora nodorum SN15]EAT83923.1 hypothetical protein SNOG_08755 [Parastagonospora nodorum SN15]
MDIARHPAATRGAPALAGNSLATSETSNPSLQSPTSTPPADPDHSQANLASRLSSASVCSAPTSTSYAIGEKKPRASAELGCNYRSAFLATNFVRAVCAQFADCLSSLIRALRGSRSELVCL